MVCDASQRGLRIIAALAFTDFKVPPSRQFDFCSVKRAFLYGVGPNARLPDANPALLRQSNELAFENNGGYAHVLGMKMPLRFVDNDYTPRLWAEFYPVLRHIKTDDLFKKMLRYKDKPVATWRADDWGLLDAINKMLTLRASSRHHHLKNDSPADRNAAFWAKVDKELEFYYSAQYPGKELAEDE